MLEQPHDPMWLKPILDLIDDGEGSGLIRRVLQSGYEQAGGPRPQHPKRDFAVVDGYAAIGNGQVLSIEHNR
ncbi:hypothetical protein D3C72_2329850 [compost metagenome]